MLREAASGVGPLPLRLREGAYLKHYKGASAKLKWGGGGSVNDTTPGFLSILTSFKEICIPTNCIPVRVSNGFS